VGNSLFGSAAMEIYAVKYLNIHKNKKILNLILNLSDMPENLIFQVRGFKHRHLSQKYGRIV
jgi:hypothetical protein